MNNLETTAEEKAAMAVLAKKARGKKGKGGSKAAKATKPAKEKKAKAAKPTEARDGSKKAIILELLRRKDGATLEEIMKATGWQKHSVHGFLAGQVRKKMGLAVESEKKDGGERTYRIG